MLFFDICWCFVASRKVISKVFSSRLCWIFRTTNAVHQIKYCNMILVDPLISFSSCFVPRCLIVLCSSIGVHPSVPLCALFPNQVLVVLRTTIGAPLYFLLTSVSRCVSFRNQSTVVLCPQSMPRCVLCSLTRISFSFVPPSVPRCAPFELLVDMRLSNPSRAWQVKLPLILLITVIRKTSVTSDKFVCLVWRQNKESCLSVFVRKTYIS
jgi:hypothetical protein